MVKLFVETIVPDSNKFMFPVAAAPPSLARYTVKVSKSPSLAFIELDVKLVTAKLGGVDISILLLLSENVSISESQNCSPLFLDIKSLIDSSTVQKPVKSEFPPDKNVTEGCFPLNVNTVSSFAGRSIAP